jgi:outer membrane immunogenic protein
MRRLVLAAVMVATAHGALAADMPDLPVLRGFVNDGPRPTRTVWEGFYVGGQGSYSWAQSNLTGVNNGLVSDFGFNYGPLWASPPLAFPFPGFLPLARAEVSGASFGGFVGYNAQWDDAIISLEGNYSRTKFTTSSGGRPLVTNITTSGGYLYQNISTSQASLTVNDLATFRVRGGWAAGCFMPYAFAGLALGDSNLAQVVTARVLRSVVDPNAIDPNASLGIPLTVQTQNSVNRLTYGYTAGVGSEVMLTGNVFARAEYEFVRLVRPIEVNVNTIRGGLGYKF